MPSILFKFVYIDNVILIARSALTEEQIARELNALDHRIKLHAFESVRVGSKQGISFTKFKFYSKAGR